MNEEQFAREIPLVSIIMNCYNGEEYLREAIDSVYAQNYTNWEIIFWDNASIDNTQKIATSYDARLKYFRSDVNTSLGEARNKALQKAAGEHVAFLDVDDVYLPGKLQRQVRLMESGEFGLIYGSAIVINKDGKEVERSKMKYSSGFILNNLLKRYEIVMASVMIRRSILVDEKLEFGESLRYAPDYNLFMKIAAQYQVGVSHDFIVKYRRTPGSLSRKTLHLVSQEVGQTLDELQSLYPQVLMSVDDGLAEAKIKLNFYDAVSYINIKDYSAARSALKPAIRSRWEYLVIYLVLFLPIPRRWMLHALNR